MLLELSWSVQGSIVPLVLGRIVDGFISCENTKEVAWNSVGGNIILYVGLWAFVHLSCGISDFIKATLFPNFSAHLRMRTFAEVEKKSYGYFINNLSGNISSKISMFQEKSTNLLGITFELLLPTLLSLLLAFSAFCIVKLEIAAALFVWFTSHMFVCIYLGSKCASYEEKHSNADNLLNGGIVDSISNHFSWRLFTNEKFEYENILKYQQHEVATAEISMRYIAKLRILLSVLTVCLGICGVNAIGYYYWQRGEISVGSFVFIINSTIEIVILTWIVGFQLQNIFIDIGSCKQAFSVISLPEIIKDNENAKKLIINSGKIEFKSASFGYSNSLLFKDLSIIISAKEKIGLVGCSGNGKTTFCNLILRLFDLRSGKILIDNQNISHVTQQSLRSVISVVPQDPVLFHRSIFENIRYGNSNASSEEIISAAKNAHVSDFLDSFDEKYDFNVGEFGNKLSKGQKQRVAIARAILKNAPILFLDEATSALDSISEKLIQDSLKYIMQNKTVITIAHRLSTLKQMDRILVFDMGRIIEAGNHDQLVKEKGKYYELWKAQADGFIGYQ